MKKRTNWQSRLRYGRKPKFKIPYTDYCISSNRVLREKSFAMLKESFLIKGKQYYSIYLGNSFPNKPWFHQLSIPREQITLISRIRSNHYNLNASLHRKNILNSSACDCGDPYQDINHIIFYCSQTRQYNRHLIYYLKRLNPLAPINILPLFRLLPYKLCRLLTSFFKSIKICIWTFLNSFPLFHLWRIPFFTGSADYSRDPI